MRLSRFMAVGLLFVILTVALMPVAAQDGEVLTVYSGRTESLIQPILDRFTADTGVRVEVRYGSTAEMANLILEEGANSPADVFIAQDAGALGAVANAGLLAPLPNDVLERVPAPFRSPDGLWVGISGRARVLVYNPVLLEEMGLQLPDSIFDLTGSDWNGLIGWAPTNGSLQANVTAMRVLVGDDETRAWLEGIVANSPQTYEGNTQVVQAVIDGEVAVGLVNHYYIFRFLAEDPEAPVALHFFPGGDPGALINVAGGAVVASSTQQGLAQRLLLYLLGTDAQTYFAESTFEYPLVAGVPVNVDLPPLESIEAPDIDLTNLDDLQGTLDMIEASGALDG